MPVDRVLIEIITHANMAGVAEAKAGFMGLGLSTLALGAGLGVLVGAGKSAIDIAEKHEAAERGLEQAYAASGHSLNLYKGNIDDFIQSNRAYISDQSEVLDGYAALTRSGLTQIEVQKDMGRALDLAALKHKPLSEAVDLLVKAEHGRMKGLIDLGITTSKYTDAEGNLIVSQHSVAQAMDELDPKLEGGRLTTTKLSQSTNNLSNDWQDLANKAGPGLIGMMDAVVDRADKMYKGLDALGKNDAWWKNLNDGLIKIAKSAEVAYKMINALSSAGTSGIRPGSGLQGLIDWANPFPRGNERAGGGPVVPGGVYTVGERGPETLVMGSRGGMVIPNGGGGGGPRNVTFNIYGATDPAAVARAVDRRLSQLSAT